MPLLMRSLILCLLLAGSVVLRAASDDVEELEQLRKTMTGKLGELKDDSHFRAGFEALETLNGKEAVQWLEDINKVLAIQYELDLVSFRGAEMCMEDIISAHPGSSRYARDYLAMLPYCEQRIRKLEQGLYSADREAMDEIREFLELHRKTLLKNPVLEDLEIYAIRNELENARQAMAGNIGRNMNNWTTNASIRRKDWDNEICRLSDLQGTVVRNTVFRPEKGAPVKDMDLHWKGDRMLFSSLADNGMWHVFEMDTRSRELQCLTPVEHGDVDFFDACYVPDGRIVMASTAGYAGVPCIGGGQPTSDLYILDPEDGNIRQLSFGQDCNWNPVVLNTGRICFLRWEYTDNSHYFTRILMNMNPDGTAKKEYYGSGSYFPNSLFDARPIPGKANEFIGIVSGHHGIGRSGRLMIFDPTLGRKEADGVVQEIPGYGKKVEPVVKDRLVDGVWPQFLTPYPIDDHYFLVSAKPGPGALWGIYLADRYDNMTLLHQGEGEAYAEPVVVRESLVPPVIPDRVKPGETTSTVYITDIYEGQGLKGIPRGSVRNLRIYAYQYGYNKVGGHDLLALEGGWDVKRILGTVPVEEDGSAMFTIPANTPISMQPLDEEGAALQLMRSWMTGMPGEVVSCIGCHESQNTVPPSKFTLASRKSPAGITPWYGPVRPVAYNTELKPVIELKCVACHNGSDPDIPDFSSDEDAGYHGFSKSYMALHPYVRRPGCESDFHTLEPMDFHISTSELVQMLKKGHHGVELDAEEWDRLITWIDMNVPFHGKFNAPEYKGYHQPERRDKYSRLFGNVTLTGEKEFADALLRKESAGPAEPLMPVALRKPESTAVLEGWPLSEAEARELQESYAVNGQVSRCVELQEGVSLEFVRIPAGKFVFGNNDGQPDQQERIAEIEKPFWMATTEINNALFRSIFPEHDSRFIDQQWKDHIYAGYPANEDRMPAIRVSWEQAMEFCELLSDRTGLKIKLPTEEQWEWAARAGSGKEMYFGDARDDFSSYENLADYTLRDLAVVGVDPKPMRTDHSRFRFYNFVPKEEKYNDGVLTPQGTGQYLSNAWGLHDMLGNVAEWTRSEYHFYDRDKDLKVARGGSWRDRPAYSTVATRDGYLPYQKVFNVGLRLIIEN